MPIYPKIAGRSPTQQVTDTFYGLERKLKARDGAFIEMQNLCSDHYPLLASREKRGVVAVPGGDLDNMQGIIGKEKLCYVESGIVYYDGHVVSAGVTLSESKKQVVSFGAYVLIWPDKWYFNTADLTDKGYMEASATATDAVFSDGILNGNTAAYNTIYSETADFSCFKPGDSVVISGCAEQPKNNIIAVIKEVAAHTLRFGENTFSPYSVRTCHIKKDMAAGLYSVGNSIDGFYNLTTDVAMVDGDTLIIAHGGVARLAEVWRDGEIIFTDTATFSNTMQTGATVLSFTQEPDSFNGLIGVCEDEITLARKVPDMDYVCEAQNRVWGCRYGMVDGELINEIYASKLGDFKNWNCYQGISTDSYAASCGTDGAFTGAIAYNGYPLFFKEETLHRVYPSSSGAHQILDRKCMGVKADCSGSLAIVDNILYYLSPAGVCGYQGSSPYLVGENLGEASRFSLASGGCCDNKYYLSVFDSELAAAPDETLRELYVYDPAKRLWHRQDWTLKATSFAAMDGNLYCITSDNFIKSIRSTGTNYETSDVSWSATTGIMGYQFVGQKYISRFNIRLKLAAGATADVEVQYDSDGIWQHVGHTEAEGTRTFLIPVRPRRCDHWQLRISGTGEVRIYSFAKMIKEGSDEQCRS